MFTERSVTCAGTVIGRGREVEDGADAGLHDAIHERLRRLRGHGDERDVRLAARDVGLEFALVADDDAVERPADERGIRVVHGDDVEAALAEPADTARAPSRSFPRRR